MNGRRVGHTCMISVIHVYLQRTPKVHKGYIPRAPANCKKPQFLDMVSKMLGMPIFIV